MKLILEIVSSGTAYLEKRKIDEARLNMEHLLAHVLGCRRLDLYLRFSEPVPEAELVTLRELLRRRGDQVQGEAVRLGPGGVAVQLDQHVAQLILYTNSRRRVGRTT